MNKPVAPIDVDFDDYGPLYASRKKVYPQSVSGTFRRIKWGLMAFCLGVYYVLPFVRWNRGLGAPDQAVLVDIPNSRFYFFLHRALAARGLLFYRAADRRRHYAVSVEFGGRTHLVRVSLPANRVD